ncbi:MAG: hypothetical protein AB9835_13920 [Eubacteriales bacterium]
MDKRRDAQAQADELSSVQLGLDSDEAHDSSDELFDDLISILSSSPFDADQKQSQLAQAKTAKTAGQTEDLSGKYDDLFAMLDTSAPPPADEVKAPEFPTVKKPLKQTSVADKSSDKSSALTADNVSHTTEFDRIKFASVVKKAPSAMETTKLSIPKLEEEAPAKAKSATQSITADTELGEESEELAGSDADMLGYLERSRREHEDDNDNLMKVFGMVDADIDDLEEFPEEKPQRVEKKRAKDGAPAYEYTSRTQNKEIFEGYRKNHLINSVKLITAGVLLFFALYLEIAPVFGWYMPAYMQIEQYNVVYILIDLQLLLLAALLCGRNIIEGITSIFKLEPGVSTFTLTVLLTAFAQTLITYNLKYNQPDARLFNSVAVLCVFCQLLYNQMALRRELYSFSVVSSKKQKFIIAPVKNKAPEHEVFYDYIPENGEYYTVNRASFLDNFYRRASVPMDGMLRLKIILPIIILTAAVLFAVLSVMKKDMYTCLTSAMMLILTASPLSCYFAFMLPSYNASRKALDKEAALIGGAGLTEYANSSVITLQDSDVFPAQAIKMSSVRVYGSNRFEHIIYHAANIFENLGGPLADVFSASVNNEIPYDKSIEFLEIRADGIKARTGGKEVYIGKNSFISDFGYTAVHDTIDEVFEKSMGKIMYIAYDNEVAAKFYIKYQIDPEFELTLKSLAKANICVSVRTFDPNIDDAMLGKYVKTRKYPVRVIKNTSVEDIPTEQENGDSGIVSKLSVKSLVEALIICDRTKNAVKSNSVIKYLTALTGVALVSFFAVSGSIGAVTAIYLLLFQCFWILPMLFTSNVSV